LSLNFKQKAHRESGVGRSLDMREFEKGVLTEGMLDGIIMGGVVAAFIIGRLGVLKTRCPVVKGKKRAPRARKKE